MVGDRGTSGPGTTSASVPQLAPALLAWATWLADTGWRTFGTNTRKQPIYRGWQTTATTDRTEVLKFWRRHPYANPAVVLDGLVAVDIDTPTGHGVDGWSTWAERAAGHVLPATWRVTTASGGGHIVFRSPAGLAVTSGAGKLGPGVDVKAGGGAYLVGPGSWIGGACYRLLDATLPAPLPGWLAELLTPPPATFARRIPRNRCTVTERYVAAAVSAEVAGVLATEPGRRNERLNMAAFALARFVVDGSLEALELVDRMVEAGLDAGLGEGESRRTVDSALRARERSL